MLRNYKLSEVINNSGAGLRVKDIYDYSMVDAIFKAYYNNRHEWMAKEIYFYGNPVIKKQRDFCFFKDLAIYLQDIIKNDLLRKFYYSDVVEEYYKRYDYLLFNTIRKIKSKQIY